MKTHCFSSLALFGFAICLSACNVVTGMHETANERYMKEQGQIKTEKDRQAVVFAGGQPGKISVNGTVIQNGHVDSRITIKQTTGKSEKLKSKVLVLAAKNDDDVSLLRSFSVNVSDALTAPATNKNYVLIGCQKKVEASWIAELNETKADVQDDSYSIVADTVVICKDAALPFSKVSIVTHNLYMNGSSLVVRSGAGSVVISADKVHLLGKNEIRTLGLDAASNVLPAASLELNVVQGLFDGGSLDLESQGGNCK